jgi:hypothetical protein
MTRGNGFAFNAVGGLFGLRRFLIMVVTVIAHTPSAASATMSCVGSCGALVATRTAAMAEHVKADHAECQ